MQSIDAIVRAAFPEDPLPEVFFRDHHAPDEDMPRELASRIQGRGWTRISLLDWRHVGATPGAYREYLAPAAFAYYTPSFLVGVVPQPEFMDLALEAILPSNRQRKPRGEWWSMYADSFTPPQRAALQAFLAYQREASHLLDVMDEELIRTAEAIWNAEPDRTSQTAG